MNLKDKRFTRNEQLTKALKMELIPTEATKRTIQIDNLLGADEKLRAAAASLQPLYDSFVRTVISKATPFEYDYTNLITSYIASIIDSEEKATSLYGIDISKATPYKDAKALFIKQFTEQLKSVLPEGVKSFSDITSQAFIKDIMPELLSAYPEGEEKTKMSEVLKGNIAGFAVLNRKYATSRATALATWVPERLIENLEIFASNIPSFRKFIASADSVDFVVENPEMLSMAFPDGYAACTSPAGIDGYNLIINGLVLEDGVKAKGYNALVNELNQNHKSDKTYDGPMYRKANVLYQQIMMPKAKAFVIESLEQDDDVCECLKEMHHASSNEMLDTLVSLVRGAAAHSIPVLGRNIQPLSHVITGNHNKLGDIIKEAEENRLTAALAECNDKEEKKNIRKNLANIAGYVSKKTYSVEELRKLTGIHIMSAYQSALEEVRASVISAYNNIKNSDILTSASIFRNSKAAKLIGAYMDALTGLRDLIRLITANDTENPAFVEFMNKLDDVRADMKYTIKGTNLIRNYLTRAPKDIAKEYETCFGTSALFDSKWWNGDSEGANSHIDNGTNVLLRDKGGKLYFFRNSGSSGYFTMMPAADGEEYYEAFTTCKAQSANKQMPKITFPVSLKRAFAEDPKLAEYVLDESNQMQTPVVISRKLYDMYSKGLHKKDAVGKSITEEEYKANLATIIGKYIEVINSYKVWNCFTFDFKAPECYGGLMEFFDYVDTLTCVVNWVKVSKPYIDALCDNRRALMFQINHRDLYKDKRNLDANAEIILRVLDSSVSGVPTIKLNSRPRITFRPAIFPVSVTHPAGSILLNKKDKLGRHIPAGIYREIYRYLNGHATTMSADASEWYKTAIYKTARYDIIKDKTYTRDAYFIAFTYTKNVGSNSSMRAGAAISANAKADMGEYRTLSVVRGTKDLLYYVLYDTDHKTVLKQGSLNILFGTNYQSKLKAISDERNAKSDFVYDREVAGVKDAYIGSAVAAIAKLAVENNAVIVYERFSDNFKNKMACIDNQIYRKFDKALAAKCGDYVIKGTERNIAGSYENPYQFASLSGASYAQNGILFAVNGAYTNNRCPYTGFVNVFDFAEINAIKTKRAFLAAFKSIAMNEETRGFKFKFSYKDFSQIKDNAASADVDMTKEWTVYAEGPVTVYNREFKYYEHISNIAAECYDKFDGMYKGNLVDVLDDMKDAEINALYGLFRDTVQRTVVRGGEGLPAERDGFISPVVPCDMQEYPYPAFVTAENLAKKFWKAREE